MRGMCCRFVGVLILSISACALGDAQEGANASATQARELADPRAEDRAAIRTVIDMFAEAFQSRDANSLAANFTAEGEFQSVDGVMLRGRDELVAAFSEFFARTPEVSAEVHSQTLRFVSSDSAVDEGTVAIQRGPAEPAATARYTALVVRENGSWRLAMLHESPGPDQPSIQDLDWLIGQWKSASGEGAEIVTTYIWRPGKRFIQMNFSLKEQELAFSGTQIIGVDPQTNMLHSWTFEADGGIGEADWYRDGDHWVLDAAGTLADGSTLTETNVLRRIDEDTFTWQSTNRWLDDAELPDLPPVKVSRVQADD